MRSKTISTCMVCVSVHTYIYLFVDTMSNQKNMIYSIKSKIRARPIAKIKPADMYWNFSMCMLFLT